MESTRKKRMGVGTGLVISVAVIYILLGLAMLLLPEFEPTYIIYAAGIVLVVYGIILIVKYFVGVGYRNLGDYSFSGGVLCILIGICLLIRASAVAEDFPLLLGICILFTAIVKLQNAMALRSLDNTLWPVFLIISLIFIAASLVIILDIFHLNDDNAIYIYMILVADGAVNLVETLFLALVIRKSPREETYEASRKQKHSEELTDTTPTETKEAESETDTDSGTEAEEGTPVEDILQPDGNDK